MRAGSRKNWVVHGLERDCPVEAIISLLIHAGNRKKHGTFLPAMLLLSGLKRKELGKCTLEYWY
jgi:hypothetical protein